MPKKHKLTSKQGNHFSDRIIRGFSFLVVALTFFLLPQQNSYAQRSFGEILVPLVPVAFPSPAPLPVKTTLNSAPDLTAEGIMVVDLATGMTLYEKNPQTPLYPASTTKIMTALVALDHYQLDEPVVITTVLGDKPVMGLRPFEKISVESLLYGALIDSANDAAYALAEHFPTGVSGFVEKMNEKAAALHLSNTHYTNPNGFDDEKQYTTAFDLARLGSYALTNKTINKIASTVQITVADTTFSYFHPLKNVNELLGKIPGVSGLKTGLTPGAGECLVTVVNQNEHKVLLVLLKSSDRFGETAQLINWVFANHDWRDVSYKN